MKEILRQFKIRVDIDREEHTGNISRYYLKLLPGTTVDSIEKKVTEIALACKAHGKPIIYPILHEGIVILEIITNPPANTSFDLFNMADYASLKIPVVVGKTLDSNDLIIDLANAPHALVAGTTGSGKSVLLNCMIASMLESRKNIKIALIDPKYVEFSAFKNIKQLMYPISHTSDETLDIVNDLIDEMNNRFMCMSRDDISNISEYRDNRFPYIVMVVDEFSDLALSSKKEFGKQMCLLAQKSRAAGIHIVLATQRPQASIINGAIKSNFPTRLSFRVSSTFDSKVVLDRIGAEKLTCRGDGLIISDQHNMVHFKGAFIDHKMISQIALKNEISSGQKMLRMIKRLL